jgi:broad specificity phosphatase PhoE
MAHLLLIKHSLPEILPTMPAAVAFEAAVARFFAHPAELLLGRETADEAHARFAGAVAAVMGRHRGETVAVVAHGTVITLFVARATGQEPFALWKRLGLPSFVVLAWPGLEVSRLWSGHDRRSTAADEAQVGTAGS